MVLVPQAAKQWDSVRWLLAQIYRMDAQTAKPHRNPAWLAWSLGGENHFDSLPSPQLGLALKMVTIKLVA